MFMTFTFVFGISWQELTAQRKRLDLGRLLYQDHHFLYSSVSDNISVTVDGLCEGWQIHGHPNDNRLIKVASHVVQHHA